jgi:hypothetical protein
MNVSMGSLINNYYRRKNENDDFVPQREEGAVVVLEEVDASPFFSFGQVHPGENITCLFNNLFRAPIFEHEPSSSDFIMIRQVSTRC